MAKKKHGGKRTNAGRKKLLNPKVQVSLYIRQSYIDKVGTVQQYAEHLKRLAGIKEETV